MEEIKSDGHDEPTAWYVSFVPTGCPQREALLANLDVQGKNFHIYVR
jgi:hypothetical protein